MKITKPLGIVCWDCYFVRILVVGEAGLFHEPESRKCSSPKSFERCSELFFISHPYKQAWRTENKKSLPQVERILVVGVAGLHPTHILCCKYRLYRMYFIIGHCLVLILFGTICGWLINFKNVFKDTKKYCVWS